MEFANRGDSSASASVSARPHAQSGVPLGVRVPQHDLVEIDRLGLCTPVAVDAEARLCVDEGRAVAADAIAGIRRGSLVGAAELAFASDVDAAVVGVMGGNEAQPANVGFGVREGDSRQFEAG